MCPYSRLKSRVCGHSLSIYYLMSEFMNDRALRPIKFLENLPAGGRNSIGIYYIRGERFCSGLIANTFKDNVFERILRRLIFLKKKERVIEFCYKIIPKINKNS